MPVLMFALQEEAFASRIDALATMGYTVLVSNFRRYFKLASYVSTFTDRSIVIAMGIPSLKVSGSACWRADQNVILGPSKHCMGRWMHKIVAPLHPC